MNITIIGCGWVGLPLGEALIELGHLVRGSTHSREKLDRLTAKGIASFMYDLDENSLLPEDVREKTDWLVLTIPPIQREQPEVYGQQLNRLVQQFPQLPKTIFISSTGVYPTISGVYTERYHFSEKAKENVLYQAEQALRKAIGDHLTILRPGGLFGPGRHPASSLQGRKSLKNPHGSINLIHRDDLIAALITVVKQNATGSVFNVVYPAHPAREVYYTQVIENHQLEPIAFLASPSVIRIIDGSRIEKELGFVYRHTLDRLNDCFDL